MKIDMMATIIEGIAHLRMDDCTVTYEEIVDECTGVFNEIVPKMHDEHMDMWVQEFNEALSRGTSN